MKVVRYMIDKQVEYGIWEGDQGQSAAGTPYDQLKKLDRYHKLSEIKLLSPCLPSKVVAIGLNYRSPAKEVNMPLPEEPLMFFKPST